jgi:hypothetical protein
MQRWQLIAHRPAAGRGSSPQHGRLAMKLVLAFLTACWLAVAYYSTGHYVSDNVWLLLLPLTYFVVLFMSIWS